MRPILPQLWGIVFLLSFFLFLMPDAWAGSPPRHAVLQKFEPARNNGTPIVVVRFSDTVTGRFMVDTGAADCLMTDAFAKRLGYKPELSNRFLLGMLPGGFLLMPMSIRVPALNINGLKITEAAFLVVGPRQLPTLGGQPVDGILGGTLLSQFALLLDYPRHNLVWITPGNLDGKAVAALGFGPENAVPLSQETSPFGPKINHYSAHVELKTGDRTRATDMLIDTGSPFSSLSYDTAQRLKLTPLHRQAFKVLFMEENFGNIARVSSFRVGRTLLSDVSVLYPEGKDTFLPSLIGENILSGAFSLLDFGPHRFYLKPILPWLTQEPLSPVDRSQVDWDRLRHAPELPTAADVLAAGLTPEAFEGRKERVARLRASLVGGTPDAAVYARIGTLLHTGKDEAGAQAAFDKSISLLKANAEAHSEDPARVSPWAIALLAADRDEEAVSLLQKASEKAPDSAALWRILGLAQETQAARKLLGAQLKITDVLDADLGSPDLNSFSEAVHTKLEPARAAQIQAERRQARESYDRAVSLAPQEPEGYRARADFGVLDFYLDGLMRVQGVKGKGLSPETELAGALTDYQNYVRSKSDDPDALRRAAIVDLAFPLFHDRNWLKNHLRGTSQTLAAEALMTASAAQSRLESLGRSSDKAVAAPALEALGAVQDIQNDAGAETSWRHALALDPNRPAALQGLATRLVASGRLEELCVLLETQLVPALSFPGRLVPVRVLLASTLLALDLPGAAEAQARLALQSAPNNPTVSLLLAGLLLGRSGNTAEALTEAAHCLTAAQAGVDPAAEEDQQASLKTMQAVLMALTGDPTAARRRLLEIVHSQPTCTQAREALTAMTPMTTVAP